MSSSPLDTLPLDLLTDNIFPLLPAASLAYLCSTSRNLRALLDGEAAEIVWKRKAIQDFNFPPNTGRRSGWKELYKRLSRRSTYVWGQNSNGRLGIHHRDGSLRQQLIGGGLTTPTLLELPAPPVSLSAGGWSFHALTSTGSLISWGTLDGGSWVMGNAPLSEPGTVLEQPTLSPLNDQLREIVQVEAGRKHVLMRNSLGEVWEMRSFGRAVRVEDEERRWGPEAGRGKDVVAVEAAWEHSAVLTSDGSVFLWWEPGPMALTTAAEAAGEADLDQPQRDGVAFALKTESVQLPSIPSPEPREKITLIASGDTFIIALTTHSRLFFCDVSPVPEPAQPHAPHGSEDAEDSPVRGRASRGRLEAAFTRRTRGWRFMRKFCDMHEIGTLQAFRESPPAPSTVVTHITAHFHSFAVYSVPSSLDSDASIVLLGDDTWNEESQPQVIPELQNRSVIKVAQGDYHKLALTSNGQLFSWGSYSAGALGLGHPQLLNTPLSAPWPPPPTQDLPQSSTATAQRFPGFAPGRPIARIPDPPQQVEQPTLVRFPGDVEDAAVEGERKNGKFVFAITASGWHSGALAVDIAEGREELDEEPTIRLRPGEEEVAREEQRPAESRGIFAGLAARGFRVGLAGAGIAPGNRGVGR